MGPPRKPGKTGHTVPSLVHLEYSCPGFLLDVIMRAPESYFRSSIRPVEPDASRSGYPGESDLCLH